MGFDLEDLEFGDCVLWFFVWIRLYFFIFYGGFMIGGLVDRRV